MPELPEVEAARRAVEEHCIGKKITRAIIADDAKVIDGVSASDFQSSITGKTIVAALRKGKSMWLQLDSPPFPSFQFGMSGAVYIKGVAITKYKRSVVKDEDEWPSKYSKVFLEFADGLEVSFTDKRRFAKVRLLQNPASVPPISELGPDALLEPMALDEFVDSLHMKKTGIKALLLDQTFISGIGNWIADEVLYQAKIHPLQIASNLSRENCESLHKCIYEVLEKAVEVDADGNQFPSSWIFHSREKKPGKAFIDGKKIEFITAGGRTSAYVPELQKLSGTPSRKASTEARKGKSGRKPAVKKASITKDVEKESVIEDDAEKESDEGDGVEDSDEEELKNKTKVKCMTKKTGYQSRETKKRKRNEHSLPKAVPKTTTKGRANVKTDASLFSETKLQPKKRSRKN